MGARTDAARAEVLDARSGLEQEIVRLEASGRAAVDIPARLRREPAKVLGTAGGAAFLLLGGPRRTFHGIRRAIFGPDANLPKTMLPKEIEKTLRKLGTDGDRVRGTLEREFADYLDERAPQRRDSDLAAQAITVLGSILRPVGQRLGKQLAERALDADATSFSEAVRKARERMNEQVRPSSKAAADALAPAPVAPAKPIAAPAAAAKPVAKPGASDQAPL